MCHHDSWCSVTADGEVVLCHRNPVGAYRSGDSGAGQYWLHWRGDGPAPSAEAIDLPREMVPKGPPAAPVEVRDAVYRRLLECWPLSAEHREALTVRGLEAEQIEANGYATVSPKARERTLAALSDQFGADTLATVPGFAADPKGLSLWNLPGLVIPVRGHEGQIAALQCRPDSFGGGKYLWVSLARKGGAGAGAPIHHPAGTPTSAEVVRLVEGPLKADVVHALDPEIPTIAMASCGSFAVALPALQSLGARRVALSLDSDWRTNRAVAWGLGRAIQGSLAAGLEVAVETWDALDGKGPDDLRANGCRPILVEGEALAALRAEVAEVAESPGLMDDAPAEPPRPALRLVPVDEPAAPAGPSVEDDVATVEAAIRLGALAVLEEPVVEALRRLREVAPMSYNRARVSLKGLRRLSIRDLDRLVGPPPGKSSPPAPRQPSGDRHKWTDLGNSRRLVERFGEDIRYSHAYGAWLVWDGTRWVQDRSGEVERHVKATVEAIADEASTLPPELADRALEWAEASEHVTRIQAAERLARSEPGIPVAVDQLDRDPWLLNLANGTLDLRDLTLRPHDRGDLQTKIAPVSWDPDATCPAWDRFLLEITCNRPALVDFLQRLIGYCATGVVREHILAVLHGSGGNGKGTLVEVLLRILGDYATTISPQVILADTGSQHPTVLCDLEGRRLISTEEVGAGEALDEALVKRATGGNRIRARRMRADTYEFSPTHKILMATNDRPEIKGTDEGIWRRVKLIPFDASFSQDGAKPKPGRPAKGRKADLGLVDKLMAEAPGILAWIARGTRLWDEGGLQEPEEVAAAVAEYRDDMDDFKYFAQDELLASPHCSTPFGDLYERYTAWCTMKRVHSQGMKRFGNALRGLGYRADPKTAIATRIGVALRSR